MIIKRTSKQTGIVHTKDLAVSKTQIKLWQKGMPPESAFPQLNTEDRAFIATGQVKNDSLRQRPNGK